MNILFLTIGRMESIEVHSLYPDLLRQFREQRHDVYIVSPYERRIGGKTSCNIENGVHMLRVKTGNITKCNIIEKGLSTLRIESQFVQAIKKYFSSIKFDLILYSTPPITFANVVQYVKKRDGATSYLLLKDIFPQNAVDLGMMQMTGIKGLIYKYFRMKEKKLYSLSDRIGCMSLANVEYVLNHNPEISKDRVEVCPNSIDPVDMTLSEEEKKEMRIKYDIPLDKKVFVYGGNLGKPQDVPFIVACLKACAKLENAYFVIAGSGTDRHFLEEYMKEENPSHVKLFGQLPKSEYDKMIACCDVGLIFLDHRFTIPNFPSRLLSYMQVDLPILACTDPNSDVGKIITQGGFGWWCESNDVSTFCRQVEVVINDIDDMFAKGKTYLNKYYTVEQAYHIITDGLHHDIHRREKHYD